MTEVRPLYRTPIILVCHTGEDQYDAVQREIAGTFGQCHPSAMIVINREGAALPVERVRQLLQELSFGTAASEVRHSILLHADLATKESQNTLLKILEEPPAGTQFWLATDQLQGLLPTVVSRCTIRTLDKQDAADELPAETAELAARFGAASYRELIEEAGRYSDRAAAQKLVVSLLQFYHRQLHQEPTAPTRKALERLMLCRKRLAANVNTKLALESCFFSLKQLFS
jgi:hypothetical protein